MTKQTYKNEAVHLKMPNSSHVYYEQIKIREYLYGLQQKCNMVFTIFLFSIQRLERDNLPNDQTIMEEHLALCWQKTPLRAVYALLHIISPHYYYSPLCLNLLCTLSSVSTFATTAHPQQQCNFLMSPCCLCLSSSTLKLQLFWPQLIKTTPFLYGPQGKPLKLISKMQVSHLTSHARNAALQ